MFPEWLSISLLVNKETKEKNYLAVFTDLSSLRESQEKIVFLAYHDELTGLLNRQKIIFDIAQKKPKVCVIFNIDDFKEINDFFGITAADMLLKQLGTWFSEIYDATYRIAGDEFAILLYEETSWDKIYHELVRVLSLFEEKVFIIKNENINIRMTVGVSMGEDELFTHADMAMHQGKNTKRPITLYSEANNIEEKYHANITMSATVRKAIIDQRIICYYQPIVNLLTGKIDKYETLVRMIDENGTIIPPLEFLSIAKKTNLYPQITLEVINQACSLFATRPEEFSINLSDSDIRNKETTQEIIRIITKTGTASRIVFEILESEGIENYDEVVKFITQVKHLGSKIAIDDFGTGYSNFENILKLNVDYIKIDGSLIQGITKNPRHHIIVETIIEFARKIGAKTIAEYVSDASIYTSVKKIGVDYSQGYYTGKPVFLFPVNINL
ncbi:MAG: bifunctional diguanylate cyclase/phosphodiesterase [Campylobacteraceae bacterium]|nr:bifunctional diguanylate cyclase/phosphodiesterase [Campylobacteraceae bacterium]